MLYIVLALFCVGITALMAIGVAIVSILVYDKLSNIPLILDKLQEISANQDFIPEEEPVTHFKTADGRFKAESIEELLDKMINSPESSLTEEDVESLKKIFDQIIEDEDEED